MSETPLLGLPLLEAAQAQKHVTHNEALLLLDGQVHLSVVTRTLASPPASLNDGDRYLIASGANGDWLGHDGAVALREAGAWQFSVARKGWRLWLEDEQLLLVYTGTVWRDIQAITTLQNMALLGVNATADTNNRLTVQSPAVLFDNAGNGSQVKVNKHAAGDTASLLCQTNYSGRAEMGLAGDDDFHVKVSADGSIWREAIRVDRTSGAVSLPNTTLLTDSMAEGSTNLYFTAARVLATLLAGLSTATNAAIAASDTVLAALGKLQAQINGHFGAGGSAHPAATTAVNGFMSTADKAKLNGVAAGANLYVHPNHSGDVTSAGDGAQTIAANAVTNTKLAAMPARTLKGNAGSGAATAADLTSAQVNTLLAVWGGRLATPLALP